MHLCAMHKEVRNSEWCYKSHWGKSQNLQPKAANEFLHPFLTQIILTKRTYSDVKSISKQEKKYWESNVLPDFS